MVRARQLAGMFAQYCARQVYADAISSSCSTPSASLRHMHSLNIIRHQGAEECSTSSSSLNCSLPSYTCIPSVSWPPSYAGRSSQQRRLLHSSSQAAHDGGASEADIEETISVIFVDKDGKDQEVRAPLGKNLLEVAHDNEIDLEGACEGSLACSTCHVIVEDEEYYKKLPEPCDDELDMLDLAFELKETSRLGCQIVAAKELDGLRVRIPSATRNFYVDGHKPKPH